LELISDEAKAALTKAVTDQGLSVQEYTAILAIAQNDADVRDKLLQRAHRPSSRSGGDVFAYSSRLTVNLG